MYLQQPVELFLELFVVGVGLLLLLEEPFFLLLVLLIVLEELLELGESTISFLSLLAGILDVPLILKIICFQGFPGFLSRDFRSLFSVATSVRIDSRN